MTTVELDMSKVEAFGGQMVGFLNGGAAALGLSIGHQTGLFDAMAELPPATSDEIAEAAGLNERYVREWLGAMVTAGVVEYDRGRGAYVLPPEHAALTTRAARTRSVARLHDSHGCRRVSSRPAQVARRKSRVVTLGRRQARVPGCARRRRGESALRQAHHDDGGFTG